MYFIVSCVEIVTLLGGKNRKKEAQDGGITRRVGGKRKGRGSSFLLV